MVDAHIDDSYMMYRATLVINMPEWAPYAQENGALAYMAQVSDLTAIQVLPDEMPPREGFIPPENLVGWWCHYRRAILYLGFCRDETPSEPRFIRECTV